MQAIARHFAQLLAMLIMTWSGPALAAVCAPATSQGTAPASWQTYCWLDFTAYNDTTARSGAGQNFSYTLSDGATLTFNVKTTGAAITSIAAPSWTGAAVGNTAFLGIPNRPILYQTAAGTTQVTISAIAITPPPGSPAVTAYMFVAADAESTNGGESLSFDTNGGNWTLLDQVDPISGSTYPTTSGLGTATFTETGVAGTVGGYIVGSTSPTQVRTTLVGGGLQGAMFAVRFASIRLTKVINGARVDATDQFKFDVKATSSGTILATGTTSGTGTGPFTAAAVSLASGIPLTLSESMAGGSVSPITSYSPSLSCTNTATGSSTPLPTNLATTSYDFGALQFGDAVACTFTNTAFPHVRIQKVLAGTGRRFSTDQFVMSIAQGVTTIATTTTTGTGTTVTNGATALTKVTAGQAYTFAEAAAGTTVRPQYTATMSCTNARNGSTTSYAVPSTITPILGDLITCTVTNTPRPSNAALTTVKSSVVISDPVNGTTNPKLIPGAVLSYAINVSNSGTLGVDSNTIFILDPLPAALEYNGASAVAFTNGTPVSGLSFNAATDVRWSKSATPPASFAACTDTPAAGFDPTIRFVCIRPTGVMAGATASGQPSFTVSFQTRIK
ncbi:hypothetical protein D5I55_11300 [Chakrabartia godavariana]|nr:hypothetical protein D5I55_11300 [Chakrabartia godavariana]